MQGPIAQALALTAVGNAALRGADVAAFWPDAAVFHFSRACEFRRVDLSGDRLIAADPLAWFETLRGVSSGLRLHNTPRAPEPGQTLPVEECMLVGFVGGGPAWIIEAVGAERSTLWQGFDRLGDRTDPNQKIWLHAYLLVGETAPQDFSAAPLTVMTEALFDVLEEIEALARIIKAESFAECFRAAREALATKQIAPSPIMDDFTRYAGFDLAQQRMLQAIGQAWVFGGMGSWNDIVAPTEHAADYDRLSEQLFRALNDAICALANSTYSGAATS
jgi:hypothetical protein